MKNAYSAENFLLGTKSGIFLKIAVILLTAALLVCSIPVGAVPAESAKNDLGLNCKSAILMEASTGKVLYEQSADLALPPASVTKIMTLLLVMEAIESGKIGYADKVRASANACSMGGSQIYLEENEEMSVEDLVKSVVIASANDAAVALAEYVCGTEEAFVKKMNEKASELGMKNTCFENTNGLDDTVQKHLTSARDIAIMSRELIKYPKITEYSSIWMDTIRNGEFGLTNTNRLVRFYKGATGLKTGSTSKAGFCISATAERNGMTLICVIMGAPSRDVRNAAAVSLLDYGFANYGIYRKSGEEIKNVPVVKGNLPTLDAEYGDISQILGKNEISSVTVDVNLPESVEAPVRKGDAIGEVICKVGERELCRQKIVAKTDVERINLLRMINIFWKKCASII